MDVSDIFDILPNSVKPFWSWNGLLERDELLRQIRCMKDAGINGFFMHARGGLLTPYMGREWMDLVGACIDEAAKLGMEAWLYDENGWPSGFADGAVPACGEEFQQKRLRIYAVSDDTRPDPRAIRYFRDNGRSFEPVEVPERGCIAVGFEVNRYYIDTFNPEAVKCFLSHTHEVYYSRFSATFGGAMRGFFTDEPQYGNDSAIPWSPVLADLFYEKYGYSLVDNLLLLFRDYPGHEALRSDFYNLVSQTFQGSFIKQIYDWCSAHNCRLTGHMMNEDSLEAQMRSTAGVMSCYEYFHEPGIDWLGREIKSPLIAKQLGSAASQLGRKTLTESFALCGWDVSLNELKWIAQNQFVNGVSALCPHLESYTIQGARKRDFPASQFIQLPWFRDGYKVLCDYFSRLGGILDAGQEYAPLLVVHMMQSAFVRFDPSREAPLQDLESSFDRTVRGLAELHIPHHYGDEFLMQRHGGVSDGHLRVGRCEYSAVLLPDLINIKESTLRLLTEFAESGGMLYVTGGAPSLVDGRPDPRLAELLRRAVRLEDLTALRTALAGMGLDVPGIETGGAKNPNVYACRRTFPDGDRLYYLVNNADAPQSVTLTLDGRLCLRELDLPERQAALLETRYAHDRTEITLEFAPYGSHVLLARAEAAPLPAVRTAVPVETVALRPRFQIRHASPNALTLDKCAYRIDGGPWQEELAVILLQNRLLRLRRPCEIQLRFRFTINGKSAVSGLCLCAETPERFSFSLNGIPLSSFDRGHFIDRSIRRCSIQDAAVEGENTLLVTGRFRQDDSVYRTLFDPNVHETERNKLTYDTELESVYITGDFSVLMDGPYTVGPRRCIFGGRRFVIAPPVGEVDLPDITHQGFWFFSGSMDLAQTVSLRKIPGRRYHLTLKRLYAPAAAVFVNGQKAGLLAFAPYTMDVTSLLRDGDNEIVLRLYSGNRNLLGPHHRPYGESYFVGPDTFSDGYGWTEPPDQPTWTDNYSFVLFGAQI